MSEAFLKMSKRVQNLLQNQKNFQQNDFLAHVHHVTQFYSEAASKLMYNPEKVASATQEYLKNIGELGQQMILNRGSSIQMTCPAPACHARGEGHQRRVYIHTRWL